MHTPHPDANSYVPPSDRELECFRLESEALELAKNPDNTFSECTLFLRLSHPSFTTEQLTTVLLAVFDNVGRIDELQQSLFNLSRSTN